VAVEVEVEEEDDDGRSGGETLRVQINGSNNVLFGGI